MGAGFLHGKPSIDKSKGLTATAEDIAVGKGALVNGQILWGAMPTGWGTQFIPKNTTQYIPNKYYDGASIVGDVNLIPENIKSGTNIFGVVGTLAGPKKTKWGTFTANQVQTIYDVTGLGFKPRHVVVMAENASNTGGTITTAMTDLDIGAFYMQFYRGGIIDVTFQPLTMLTDGFRIPADTGAPNYDFSRLGGKYNWFASE